MASEKGILYIMTTAIDGLIKVGKTASDNFEKRMYNLEHNGYCNVTSLKRQFAIEVEDYSEKEDLFKKLFLRSRVADTELYSLDLRQVIQLFSSFEGKQVYPQDETKEEVFSYATQAVESSELPDGDYFLSSNVKGPNGKEKVEGTLRIASGKLIILKGATISSHSKIGVMKYSLARDNAKKNGNVLLEDIACESVSMAASIICGHNKNGWDAWKDKSGNKIDTYRKKETEEEED